MKKFADDHTRAKMVQIGYEEHITEPDDTREDLYCLTMPQSKALIAVIDIYRYATRWFHEDEIDLDLLESFVDDTQRRLMMPCGDDNITIIFAYDSDGVLTQSTDGGTTYTPVPEKDPRNNSPIFPPPFESEPDRCKAADSAVDTIIVDVFNQFSEEITRDNLEEVLTDWVTTYIETSNPFTTLVTVVTNLIISIGVDAIIAALDTEAWTHLRCCFEENMLEDISFDTAAWESLRECVLSDIVGTGGIFLEHLLFLAGKAGCTNLIRSARGSSEADCDCDDCNTGDMTEWSIYDLGVIEEETLTTTNIVIDGEFNAGDSKYYIILIMDESTDSVDVTFNLTGGTLADCRLGWTLTGETPTDIVLGVHNSGFGDNLGASSKSGINGLLFRSDAAFQMTVSSECVE